MKGPFTKNLQTGDGTFITGYRKATWYRSDTKPPYLKPLPYELTLGAARDLTTPFFKVADMGYNTMLQWLNWDWGNALGGNIEAVHNRAYSEFLDLIRKAPAMGTNLAEYKETLKLIGTVGGALLHPLNTFGRWMKREATQVYRRGGWKSAAEVPLVLCPNAWLTWHFGVDPLIKDYYALLERIAQPGDPIRVRSRKSSKTTYLKATNGMYDDFLLKQKVQLLAEVRRKDENLAMWNDMGLVNPAAIAWELVPFSFVVDWFYPIGQYINSITDLLGYDVQNTQRVWRAEVAGTRALRFPLVIKSFEGTGTFEAFRLQRAVNEPITMKLQRFKIPGKVSAVRGFTAISLLLGAINFKLNSK